MLHSLARLSSTGASDDLSLPSADVIPQPAYVKALARTAYVWGWPMVNQMNRRAAITKALYPGHLNGVLPAAPRGQIAMLNDYIAPSQTVGAGILSVMLFPPLAFRLANLTRGERREEDGREVL